MIVLHVTNKWGETTKVPFGGDYKAALAEEARVEVKREVVSTKITGALNA
jgi:hypothetical protein